MKTCGACKQKKPISAFAKHRRSKDGLQHKCRDCNRAYRTEWYGKNKQRHIANVRRNAKLRAEKNRDFLLGYLLAHPCIDCGSKDLRILDFDHRPEEKKLGNISAMAAAGTPLVAVQAEVEKCDVRCKNCHAIKTYERAGGNWQTAWFDANMS